jgi:hypothetical protein
LITSVLVPWSSGDDSWPTPRQRRFDSVRDYLAQVRQLAERLGLNPGACGFDSHAGHTHRRLGRQSADHSRLERGMLWVRVPPEPVKKEFVLVEQPGVLACPSSRRSRVQIPSGTLVPQVNHGTVRKPAKRPSSNLGDCGFNSRLCHLQRIASVGWALASPSDCKSPAARCAGSTPARRTLSFGPFVYRFRTAAPRAARAGSIPARAISRDNMTKW